MIIYNGMTYMNTHSIKAELEMGRGKFGNERKGRLPNGEGREWERNKTTTVYVNIL